MIGNQYFDRLVASAPVRFDPAEANWAGISDLLEIRHISPPQIVAVSWCRFGIRGIGSIAEEPALTMVHHAGILISAGQRKTIGGAPKFNEIDFDMCQRIIEAENVDDRRFGTCRIEFYGSAGAFLGGLQWSWRSRRFRDSRVSLMAVAAERDRIMMVVRALALC